MVLRRGSVVLAGWIDTGCRACRAPRPHGEPVRVAVRVEGAGDAGARLEDGGDRARRMARRLSARCRSGDRRGRRALVRREADLEGRPGRSIRCGRDRHAPPPAGSPSVVSAVALANGRSELVGRSGDTSCSCACSGTAPAGGFGDRGAVELPLDAAAGLVVGAAGHSVVGGSAGGALVAVSVDPAGQPGAPMLGPAADDPRRVAPPVRRSGARRRHLIRRTGRRALDERQVARPTVRLGRRGAARGI